MKKSITKRYIRQIVILAILFLAVTMPFRQLFRLNGLTEVRPAGAFPPVFGLLYGLPGALGCAVGNLIADILSGYPIGICTWGFAAQFLYGLLPHLMWKWKHKEETSIRLSNVRFVLQYIAIIVIDSTVMAFSLGGIMQCLGLGTLFSTGTLLLGFNNISFSLIVGIPIIIGVNIFRRNGSLTLNIQFVLLFLLLSVLSALLLGIVSYTEVMASDVDLMRRWNRIYIQVTLDFFLLWTISMVFLWYLELYIAKPIADLTHIARKYANEDFIEEHLHPHIQNKQWAAKCEELGQLHGELGFLAMGFHKMMGDVEQYITELTAATKEKQRIHTELDVAAHIQNGMLPDPRNAFPQGEPFRISAKMCPAKYVAGDFYDYFLVDEDHAAFLIADVSGKGVPASLVMMVAKTLIHNQVCNGKQPGQVFTEVNQELCRNNPNSMFVTAWLGILTLSTGNLEYVNAGHNPPLLQKHGQDYRFAMERTGFVLAGKEDAVYEQQSCHLSFGDTIFLYTDGVTEANNPKHQLYGEDRLLNILNRYKTADVEKLLEAVWTDVSEHQGCAEQFDDITMLAIRYASAGYTVYFYEPDMKYMPELLQNARAVMTEHNIPPYTSDSVILAIDELFSNICYYSGARKVSLGIQTPTEHSNCVKIFIEDDGIPFNPLEQKAPDVHKPLYKRKQGGLGIFIVTCIADAVKYEYKNNKNQLWVTINN